MVGKIDPRLIMALCKEFLYGSSRIPTENILTEDIRELERNSKYLKLSPSLLPVLYRMIINRIYYADLCCSCESN